jgi:hypothetical protein
VAVETNEPKLAPPGAGIPFGQKVFVRYWFLPRYVRQRDWQTRQRIFRKHGERVLGLLATQSPEALTRRVLVAPMAGLEDSSRYWSVAMAVEHLLIVGSLQARAIRELSRGQVPAGEADTAAVKPQGGIELDTLRPKFTAFLDDFDALISTGLGDRASRTRFRHPWFGPLTAAGWHALSALHQGLHRRQCEAILAGQSAIASL